MFTYCKTIKLNHDTTEAMEIYLLDGVDQRQSFDPHVNSGVKPANVNVFLTSSKRIADIAKHISYYEHVEVCFDMRIYIRY